MHKKIILVVTILAFFYFILFLQAKSKETVSTFPAIKIENQDTDLGVDLDFEEINIDDGEGNNINGLYLGTGTGKTVYYFHGNGGALNYFYDEIKYINSLGYNVISYDYPGYGKSESYPHKESVDNFSQVFYDYIKNQKNIKDEELIIWGSSIGTAIAVDFASKNDFDKLLLVSPLSSRYDMGDKIFGFSIQKLFFLEDSYKTKDLVRDFDKAVLIIHGNSDEVISIEQGKKVYENYGRNLEKEFEINKFFIEIDNFGHNGIISSYGEILKYKIGDFLKEGKLSFTKENYINIDENYIDKEQKIKEKYYYFLDKINREKLEKENLINSFDLETDESLTKFLNNLVSFNEVSYIPSDLEYINSDFIIDTKGNAQVREEALNALEKMGKDFFRDFDEKLVVVSSYRSYIYQKGIKDRGCPDNLCAKAGYSEHQSGLAVDLWEASTRDDFLSNPKLKKYYDWLEKNAYKYGFHNTYQKGLEVDGYDIEPWHWRYLGVDLATYLIENKITIAEFYKQKNSDF